MSNSLLLHLVLVLKSTFFQVKLFILMSYIDELNLISLAVYFCSWSSVSWADMAHAAFMLLKKCRGEGLDD